MPLSFSDIISPDTKEQVFANLIELARTLGFPTTAWQVKSFPRFSFGFYAQGFADWTSKICDIGKSGFLRLGSRDWVVLLADSFYDVQAKPSEAAEGNLLLTDSANLGPFSIAPQTLLARSNNGLLYRNINPNIATLPQGGSVVVPWQAESPGSAYNVPVGTPFELSTPLPGVTVSTYDSGAGTWITVQGVDEESADSIATRCEDKWGVLGQGPTKGYREYAKEASTQVTRVTVYEASPVGGQVTIYLAGPNGALDQTVVDEVIAYLNDGRRPQCVTLNVFTCTNSSTTLRGVVRVSAALLTAAQAYVTTQLTDLQQNWEIGEDVPLSEIIERVQSAPGVKSFVPKDASGNPLTPGDDDISLSSNQAATFINSLTWQAI